MKHHGSLNLLNRTVVVGDNLDVMRGMNDACVDLIATDPPFNSKRDYESPLGSPAAGAFFKDSWHWDDVDEVRLAEVTKTHPAIYDLCRVAEAAHGTGTMAYTTMMALRVIEMHRILKPTGSLYLHCDQSANFLLRMVLDIVFGAENFRNEIVWQRSNQKGTRGARRSYARTSDRILFYSYGTLETPMTFPDTMPKFPHIDKRGEYRAVTPLMADASLHASPHYVWEGLDPPFGWRVSHKNLKLLSEQDRIHYTKSGKLYRKQYRNEYDGVPVSADWFDIPIARGKERTGYKTQKPIALYERIIRASSNEGDVVFDPFCGCGTTLEAAERTKRQWVGIDIGRKAASLIVERLEKATGQAWIGNEIPEVHFHHHTDEKTKKVINPLSRTDQGVELREGTEAWWAEKKRLYGEQDGNCAACDDHFESRNLEMDRVFPGSKGGRYTIGNIQLMCGNCNRRKGNRPDEYLKAEWRRIKARLVEV